MELRNAVKKIDSIVELYEDLAHRKRPQYVYPMLNWHELVSLRGNKMSNEGAVNENEKKCNNPTNKKELSAQGLLQEITAIEVQVQELLPLASKFRQRLSMKDPITNAPRYGEKTAKRVISLLEKYDILSLAMNIVHGRDSEDPAAHTSLFQALKEKVQSEEHASEAHQKQKDDDLQLQGAAKENACMVEEERQKQQKIEEENRHQREREELAARAEAARIARVENERRMAQEERDSERVYLDSIPKGVEGVKKQLNTLRNSCTSKKEIDTALGALHTFFNQISSRPEEVKFRRIRRDHPKFLEDIGRHAGGNEVLIAAGFTLEELDGVKCFFSKEPDVNFMDAWSEWFDLIKGTLATIEEEMIK
jgi:hypothetical protein